ncbi:variant erythrocyte surface antigen-1 family protein [Babesia caballi]|uniref:Variant erythrocyte surface antigen-1 family protein n=1 Tax=Babesia caballi TaxID=5871 RepID=A0AAV4M1A0_BABCB|nr:variant erythrocyte surface antigen-1 family protein [Babesia caballi]
MVIFHIRPFYYLLDCPSNLKEAIDWILRVTGKDGQRGGGDGTDGLAKAVVGLDDFQQAINAAAERLKGSGSDADSVSQALGKLTNADTLGEIIKQLAEGLKAFIGYESNGKMTGNGIGMKPTKKGNKQDEKPFKSTEMGDYKSGYVYSYEPGVAEWQESNRTTCAKIFLGCLPLIFSKLTYFYWRCHSSGGGWNTSHLTRGDLGNFLFGMDYHPRFLNGGKKGHNIIQTAMNKNFTDFSEGMTRGQQLASERSRREEAAKKEIYASASDDTNTNPTYPEFLAGCNQKLNVQMKSRSAANFEDRPLSVLHLLASCYFRCQQSKRDTASSRSPSTIREMLYFLAALPYSPNYGSLGSHISNYFTTISPVSDANSDAERMIAVADSSTNQKHNTLSAADLKYHLISTCSFSTAVLGMIQGPGASKSSEPWLYELYCNSAFNLKYPSGAALFNALAKYTYAVQFQMNFLYWQCYNNGMRCGWQYCWFGSEIEPKKNDKAVQSHLCHADCAHSSGSGACVDHNTIGKTKCGQSTGSNSPLQSFLTDCLSGFCRKIPGISNHLATCSGPCHAPMGFKADHLRSASKIGWNIMAALIPFCSSENSPLTQLSEKLGCLTKRTPRTLGDLFGFKWHLNGQLFKSGVSAEESVKEFFTSLGVSVTNQLSEITADQFLQDINNKITKFASQNPANSIDKALSLFPGLPFWYNLFMVKPGESLPAVLFKIKNIPHQTSKPPEYSGNHNDLYSLYNQNCLNQKPCGQYLRPLCYSNGATYAPTNASAYMSWILHLTDDLEYQFRELLDDFTNIDCSKVGCNQRKCSTNHGLGTHGRTSNCSCDSVVKCGGTLPLLYSKGFNFYNAFVLMGGQNKSGVKYDGPTKRSCEQFHNTLTAVLKPKAPLDKLITAIDTFLYAIRWEFFSKLSAFWTIYICTILYTFFFLLDTLHLRSHLKLTSSHSVPPLALLTSGKPLPVTKPTYLTQ